ncbi:hypothetical protein KA013_03130 [Patescibacteria group bacterium]|nr:hypothetical protein [Patescibacteria group bacterium]
MIPLIDQAKSERNEQQHGKVVSAPLTLTRSNFALYVTALNGEYGQDGNGTGFHMTNIEGMLLVR